MYSGLLPKGLSEADVSADEEDEDSGLNVHTVGDELELSSSEAAATSLCKTQPHTKSVVHNESSSDDCLPGVSPTLWQKFKGLQKEREIQKTNQPRIKEKRKRRRKTHSRKVTTEEQDADSEKTRECKEVRVKHWEELTQYFGVNDRFQPPASSRPPLKSGLEKSMERAIAEGDCGKAEELSDRLATRELAVKIAQAADCRDFARTKQEEEASRDARKKRKQVAWGFEAKQRWETKSNMGYM